MKIPEISREMLHYISRKERGVRKTLLMGVFWCILVIEAILLIGTLLYEAVSGDAGGGHLLWYALRIFGLVSVIILFMMVTLQRFLRKKSSLRWKPLQQPTNSSRKTIPGLRISIYLKKRQGRSRGLYPLAGK